MSVVTTNLNLKKPLQTDNYDINVQNENMDIIDREINQVKTDLKNIDLTASKVSIVDANNNFTSTEVEGALNELAIELKGQISRGVQIANSLLAKL